MWSCRASSEVSSSLAVALGVSLLGCGDECAVLQSKGVFSAKFSAARTPSEDKALGLPDTLEGCVRLNWGLEHRMTPTMFLTIGLQCLDKLRSDPDLRLCSAEQIQFRKSSTEIEVVIDPAYTKYSDAHETVTRACLMEKVLSQLARHVVDVSDDGRRHPAEVITLWNRHAASKVATISVLGLAEENAGTTLEAMETEFRAAYEKLSAPPGDHWLGVCRPRLGLNQKHEVSVVHEVKGKHCQECLPRQLSDLRPSQRVRSFVGDTAPLHSILPNDGTPDGRVWQEIMKHASVQVLRDAHVWKSEHASESTVKEALDGHFANGCIIQLHDLIKTYRLTNEQCNSLVRQLCDSLDSINERVSGGENCCLGSYAQVYVCLDRATWKEATKLRVVLSPRCMKASSKKRAEEVTQEFFSKLRADADYLTPASLLRALASVYF